MCKTTFEGFPTIAVNDLRIAYSLERGSYVSIIVYDILGQRVAILVSEEKPAGKHISHWSLKDDMGEVVRNGIYFCSLRGMDGH